MISEQIEEEKEKFEKWVVIMNERKILSSRWPFDWLSFRIEQAEMAWLSCAEEYQSRLNTLYQSHLNILKEAVEKHKTLYFSADEELYKVLEKGKGKK